MSLEHNDIEQLARRIRIGKHGSRARPPLAVAHEHRRAHGGHAFLVYTDALHRDLGKLVRCRQRDANGRKGEIAQAALDRRWSTPHQPRVPPHTQAEHQAMLSDSPGTELSRGTRCHKSTHGAKRVIGNAELIGESIRRTGGNDAERHVGSHQPGRNVRHCAVASTGENGRGLSREQLPGLLGHAPLSRGNEHCAGQGAERLECAAPPARLPRGAGAGIVKDDARDRTGGTAP